MQECQVPTADMLPNPIRIQAESCDFDCAKEKAFSEAADQDNSPKLVSWFDKKHQKYVPEGECCVEGEPAWLVYGLARQADLCVDINNEEFVFLFRRSHGIP